MKKLMFFLPVFLLLLSCGGKKNEPQPAVNPLWGMWVQQEPAVESKRELMFTEDNTGFVFVADTFSCSLRWKQTSMLNVFFIHKNDTGFCTVDKKYNMSIDADTLFLHDVAATENEPAESKYVRFRQ